MSWRFANSRTQSLFDGGEHNAATALTKGFDGAFLVGPEFALVGAVLAAVLISSRESREHYASARKGGATVAPATV